MEHEGQRFYVVALPVQFDSRSEETHLQVEMPSNHQLFLDLFLLLFCGVLKPVKRLLSGCF